MTEPSLLERVKPFPAKLIRTNPSGGGQYVKHTVVKQRLLDLFGHYDWQLVEIVRGDVAGKPPNPNAESKRGKEGTPDLHNVIVGVVYRLTVVIDGERVVAEDAGDCEDPHNWPHDGARLKDAVSDALKRCATHPGIGLHLWAQEDSYLYRKLKDAEQPELEPSEGAPA